MKSNAIHRLPMGHVPIHEFLDDLSLACLAQTNTHMHKLFDQNMTPEVCSDHLTASSVHRFGRSRIRTLIVTVKESWGPQTGDDYRIPRLRCLVLRSTPNLKDRLIVIPRPLRQWMPQLCTLDVRGLVNRGDIEELYQTFPRQRLRELKLETFGLQVLSELAAGDVGFLSLVQSVHFTMNVDSYVTNDALTWLMDWASVGHGRRQRLTFVFPMWTKHIHHQLHSFLEHAWTLRIHTNGLPLLHLVFRNVDVAFMATMNTDTLSLVQNPFVVFCDCNTNVRLFIHIENMDVSTASWLSIMAMPLTHTAAIETVVQLDFTEAWDASHANLFAVSRSTSNLVRYHVIKALRTLPLHYTNGSTYDVFTALSRGESRIRVNVHGLQPYALELSRIPTEEHIHDQMSRYGYIHCTM